MSINSTKKLTLLAILLLTQLVTLTACGDNGGKDDKDKDNDKVKDQVTVKFNVTAGHGKDANCQDTYPHMGVGGAHEDNDTITDLRFFVYDVELKSSKGWEKLTYKDGENNGFQADGVVLLDFEDHNDNCSSNSGTPKMNKQVVGHIKGTNPTAVRFKVGVPENLNHQDTGAAKGIFALQGMSWGWVAGYKYTRIELHVANQDDSTKNDVTFHLGETGCKKQPDDTYKCAQSNRPSIELDGYSEDKVVTLSLHELLENVEVFDKNKSTCMPSVVGRVPNCYPYFEKIGLNNDGTANSTHPAFSLVEHGSSSEHNHHHH